MEIVQRNVELVSRQSYADALQEMESCIRTCYHSMDKAVEGSAERMARMMMQSGHEAMIEFFSVTFRITCDRSTSHQIVRHRMADYAQESMRYCNFSKDKFGNSVKFIEPCGLTEETRAMWQESCLASEKCYMEMIARGAKAEVARSVLPHCTATILNMRMNMRALRNFLSLRLDAHAQADVRDIANKILDIMHAQYPVFVEDFWAKYREAAK